MERNIEEKKRIDAIVARLPKSLGVLNAWYTKTREGKEFVALEWPLNPNAQFVEITFTTTDKILDKIIYMIGERK